MTTDNDQLPFVPRTVFGSGKKPKKMKRAGDSDGALQDAANAAKKIGGGAVDAVKKLKKIL